MNKFMNTKRKRAGSIIVTALLLVITMATILTVIMTVILNSVRSTRTTTSGLISQYAADAAIERALYYTMIARTSRQVTAGQLEQFLDSEQEDLQIVFSVLGGGDVLFITNAHTDTSSRMHYKSVDTDKTVQVDAYAEDSTNGYQLVPLSETHSVQVDVQWTESSECSPGESRVVVGLVRWSPTQWQDFDSQNTPQSEYAIQCDGSNTPEGQLTSCYYGFSLDANYLYKIRATPITCPLNDITIAVNGTERQMNTFINVEGYGIDARNTIFASQATTAWAPSLLGYYNYVVFSQEQISK